MSRPSLSRPTDGRSSDPLLVEQLGRGRRNTNTSMTSSGTLSRRQQLRSRSPLSAAAQANKRKYMYAGITLVLSLFSFVLQTETAVYIQHELGWKKAYAMMYFTHGSWSILWVVQFLYLRMQKRHLTFRAFLNSHWALIRSTIEMIERNQGTHHRGLEPPTRPVYYLIRTTALVTTALTVAGSTWYLAVDMTTASDLTAIYNCSAFFAYAFSIPLLKEKPRKDKIISVAVAILGVMIVSYGGGKSAKEGEANQRALGNVVIGVGSVLYGLYEVMYKKMACPPEGASPGRSVIFANTFASCIGAFTLFVLWIPLPILHWTGWETFEMPTGKTAWVLAISVFANATFSGSFLVLISLTSPVLSSVAALLTIFLVAITDWLIFATPISAAAMFGGMLIIGAFLLLSWATWTEMLDEKAKRIANDISDEDDESSEDDPELGNGFLISDNDEDFDEEEAEEGDIAQPTER